MAQQPAKFAVEKSPEEFASIPEAELPDLKNENDTANQLVDNAMSTFLAEALSDQALIKEDVYDTIDEMIAKLDEKLTGTGERKSSMRPEFQTLESAWRRGIDYLVHQSETDALAEAAILEHLQERTCWRVQELSWRQVGPEARCSSRSTKPSSGQLGGQPYGCIVGDYEFSYDPQDITVLRGMAKISSAAHAPFLASCQSAAHADGQLDRTAGQA